MIDNGRITLNPHLLKTLRHRDGLSQQALADACQTRRLPLSIASIKRAEKGRGIIYRTARAYSHYFGVSIDELSQDSS